MKEFFKGFFILQFQLIKNHVQKIIPIRTGILWIDWIGNLLLLGIITFNFYFLINLFMYRYNIAPIEWFVPKLIFALLFLEIILTLLMRAKMSVKFIVVSIVFLLSTVGSIYSLVLSSKNTERLEKNLIGKWHTNKMETYNFLPGGKADCSIEFLEITNSNLTFKTHHYTLTIYWEDGKEYKEFYNINFEDDNKFSCNAMPSEEVTFVKEK